MSVVASPLARAWNLMAELVALTKQPSLLADPQLLGHTTANLLQAALPCPWGRLVLPQPDGSGSIDSAWGTPATSSDHETQPPPLVLHFANTSGELGQLTLGLTNDSLDIMTPSLVAALQGQIELILDLQQRQRHEAATLQRHTNELSSLQRLSQKLTAALSADEIIRELVDGARTLVSFGAIEICLYHQQSQTLAIALSRNVRHRSDHSRTYRLSDGLVGWIARHRRTLRLADMSNPPVRPLFTTIAGSPIQSYLGIPLQADDRLIGTIEIFSDQANAFSAADERMLAIAASQAAQALAGMQRYEQADEYLNSRLQQLRALQRISRELTATLYLHNILGFALDETLRATRAEFGYIALRGYQATAENFGIERDEALGVTPTPQVYIALREIDDPSTMRIVAANGYTSEELTQLINQPLQGNTTIAEQSSLRGEAIVIDELQADDRPLTPDAIGGAVASVLAVPIYFEAQVIGVINLHSRVPFTFDRDALEFVRAVADQIALAIGNEQRWTEQRRQRDLLQQRANTLNEVLRIGQELRADRSLEDVLEQISFSIVETAGFRAVVFYLVEGESDLQLCTGAGLPLTELERLRRANFPRQVVDQLINQNYQIGRCFYVPGSHMIDIAPGIDLIDGDPTTHENGWKTDDALFVPLYSTRGQLIGLLAADEPYDRLQPTRRSVEAIEIFADQAALAIENANLLREARAQTQQMTALYRASTSAAVTLDLRDLLEQTYSVIEDHLGVPSFAFVASFDRINQTTRFELFKRQGQTLDRLDGVTLPKGGWTGYIIDSGQVLVINDALNPAEQIPVNATQLGEQTRSFVGIPLRSQGQVVGVLSVQHFEPDAFSSTDIQFLSTLANQLAVAIDNINLFRQREQQIAELNVINQIGQITSLTLNIELMLGQVYEVLKNILPIDAFFGLVYVHDQNEIAQALFIDEGQRNFSERAGAPDPGSLSEWIIRQRKPLRFGDLRIEREQRGFQPTPFGNTGRQSASWLGVPLLIGESQIVGVLSIQSYTPHLYGDREQSFVTTVASQVALGVQNALLLEQARDQVYQLDILNKISATAAATLEFEQVFAAAADAMAQAVLADKARLILYDRDIEQAELIWIEEDKTLARTVFTLANHPLVAWISQKLEPYVAHDVLNDPMLSWWHEGFRRHNIRSMLIVPLVAKEQVIGSVRLDYIGRQYEPTGRQIELSLTIANQTAVALENARLFAQTQRGAAQLQHKVSELSALLEAARVLSSSLKPQAVLNSLMDVVRRQLQVTTVALWQDNGSNILLPVAMMGIPDEVARTLSVPVGSGLTGRVAALGAPLVVADVENQGGSLYPSFNRANGYTSFMGVPVRYRDRTIGVLSVMTIALRQFSDDDVQLLAGMADQAAIALENARLFDEREQRIKELSTLSRISQAINGTLDTNELLRALHQGIGEILDISISFIGLYDRHTRRLWCPIARDRGVDFEDKVIQIVEGPNTLAERLILERKPILLNTLDEVEALEPTPAEDGPPRIASYIGVPIILGSNVLGMMTVQSEMPYAFTRDDVRFLETVASQAATALGNARLFAERERRLREVSVLQEIGSAITSTLDLQMVLERLHQQIGRIVDVSTSAVVLYDAERDLMTYPVVYDQGQRIDIPPMQPNGSSGWVIRNHQALLLHTVEEFEALNMPAPHFGIDDQVEQSFLSVPILSGDEVLGVLDIQSYEQHAFNRDDLRFMVTVASQAAAAIANARLFQERGRRIDELATLNQIGQELSLAASQTDLLNTLHRQMSRLIDAKNSFIALYDERTTELSFPLMFENGERYDIGSYKLNDRESLTGWIIRNRSTLWLNGDVDQIARERGINVFKYGVAQESPRSWVGVPMIASDKVVGVIAIQNLEYVDAFSADDVRLLETIAAWGATALENTRLISESRQSVKELTALYDISISLSGTLDLYDIQTSAALSVVELIGADICVIAPTDNMKINRRRALQPAVADLSSTPIDGNAFVQAALPLVGRFGDTTTLTIRDLAGEAPQLAEMTGLTCMLAMPVVTNNQTIGVIWVGWRHAHEWQSREISLLSILATQLNQALARAQLLLSEQERRQVADTLRETAQMFTRLLTLEGIYELIFDQLARVLHYDTASLLMRNNGYLEVIGGRGFSARSRITDLRFQLSDDANLRYVVETKRPMVLEDAQLSPYFVVVPDTEHIHGWIAAPLLVDDEVIGLLCADNRTPGSYDEEDGEIAFALASQAAQAIRNARLYAEVTQLNTALEQRVAERTAQLQDEQDRLRAVHAITVELTATLELELTLNRALELAADAVEAKRGSIMLRDLQNDKLTCRAILSGNQVESTDIPINFTQGGGLAGWVIRTREAVCIPDVLTDPRWLQIEGRANEARSVIAAPLLTQDGPLGVIMLSSPNVNFFQDAQVQLLTTIANEVAIVIHNATLYKVISELAYERGIAEAQQREENSKNQAILQSLGEGVLVLDEQNHVVLFNPAAESMLGIPASYVSGRPLRHLLQYDESFVQSRRASQVYEGLSLGLQALNEQGRNHNRSLTLANPLQTIALSFSPWVGPRGATFGSVVVLRDVTREIESDRAKREFISSVSHELRTPLTSIKGYVDLLLLNAAGPLNEGQLSFLGVVKNNANRLMDLINDILEIGRIDSEKIQLNFEEVDIRQIFQDSLQTMRIQIDRKEMEVSVDVAEQVPLIIADQRRISQVVLNLTSNAVKYTFPKGQVTLRAFLNPAGMLQVEVQDTGVGISEEDQKNLFRRFQRFDNPLRDEAGGTGLGLSIAKSFVELHGGEMWVTSIPGQGSTFHFIIPVSQLNQQLLLHDNA